MKMRRVYLPAVPGIMNEPLSVELEMVQAGHYRVWNKQTCLGTVRRLQEKWQAETASGPMLPFKFRTRDDAVAGLVY